MTPSQGPLEEQQLLRQAKRRIERKLDWLVHLAVYIGINLTLLMTQRGYPAPWHFWGWTLGLVVHGLVVLFDLTGARLKQRWIQAEVRKLRQHGRIQSHKL